MDAAVAYGWISTLTREHLGTPVGLVFMAFGIAAPLAMLATLGYDYRYERLRRHGVTRFASSLVISGLTTIAVLAAGLAGITWARPDLPWWTAGAILGLCGSLLVFVLFAHLHGRSTFTWGRFFNTIAMPVMLPALPVLDALQRVVVASSA